MGDEKVQNNGKRSNERVRPEAKQIEFSNGFSRRAAVANAVAVPKLAVGALGDAAAVYGASSMLLSDPLKGLHQC